MGLVEKEIGKIYVTKDEFKIIPESLLDEFPEDQKVERIAKRVYVYSEEDFKEFYVKHVTKEPQDIYTVLVKNERRRTKSL